MAAVLAARKLRLFMARYPLAVLTGCDDGSASARTQPLCGLSNTAQES